VGARRGRGRGRDRDGDVLLWRPDHPAKLDRVGHHDALITAIAWSAGGILATGDDTGEVQQWSGDRTFHAFSLGTRIAYLAYAPGSSLLGAIAGSWVEAHDGDLLVARFTTRRRHRARVRSHWHAHVHRARDSVGRIWRAREPVLLARLTGSPRWSTRRRSSTTRRGGDRRRRVAAVLDVDREKEVVAIPASNIFGGNILTPAPETFGLVTTSGEVTVWHLPYQTAPRDLESRSVDPNS